MIPLDLDTIARVVGGAVHGATAPVTVTGPAVLDGRTAEPGGLFVAFAGEHTDGHEYADQAAAAGAVAVLGSRPTSLPTVVVDDAEKALQTLAAYVLVQLRAAGRITVVGVTGSQGKTSTKDMTAAVLAAQAPTVATLGSLNNELGVPLTVLRASAETRFLVLEMGARGRGHIRQLTDIAPLDVAMVLNVGFAHLGEFGSREAIAQAKGELIEGLRADGIAVLNADDPRVVAMRALTDASVMTFGTAEHADVRIDDLAQDRLGRASFTLRTPRTQGPQADEVPVALPVVGAHQAFNAAAAATAARAVGIALADVAAPLSTAALSQWRMELHELDSGLTLLNDSYNANPDSMRAALDALAAIEPSDPSGRRIAVLGEMRELGEGAEEEHRQIGSYAGQRADQVLVVGEEARPILEGAGDSAVLVPDNAAAIAWLRERLGKRDVVLVKASRGARLDEVAAALE